MIDAKPAMELMAKELEDNDTTAVKVLGDVGRKTYVMKFYLYKDEHGKVVNTDDKA